MHVPNVVVGSAGREACCQNQFHSFAAAIYWCLFRSQIQMSATAKSQPSLIIFCVRTLRCVQINRNTISAYITRARARWRNVMHYCHATKHRHHQTKYARIHICSAPLTSYRIHAINFRQNFRPTMRAPNAERAATQQHIHNIFPAMLTEK